MGGGITCICVSLQKEGVSKKRYWDPRGIWRTGMSIFKRNTLKSRSLRSTEHTHARTFFMLFFEKREKSIFALEPNTRTFLALPWPTAHGTRVLCPRSEEEKSTQHASRRHTQHPHHDGRSPSRHNPLTLQSSHPDASPCYVDASGIFFWASEASPASQTEIFSHPLSLTSLLAEKDTQQSTITYHSSL